MKNFTFPAEFLEEVKSRNDIVSVLSKAISMQKKGRYFWACCPFHYEKTPSFAVSEDEQFFHCYGCGESGDVISFIQKYEKVSFLEAVKMLAKDAGIEMPTLRQDDKELQHLRHKERVLQALNEATQFYQKSLLSPEGQVAREYARSRHFDDDIINHFKIGYSKDFNSLITYFRDKNVSIDVLKDAGLVEYSSYGKYYDVFASRLIFPVLNSYGDTIAYTARTMEKDPKFAKYRNSTQTIVFDKSKTVYNINTIKEIKKSSPINEIYILEGTVDVIAMYRAGIKNAVACLGTAITSEHARTLKKYVDKVILCLDGDSAGQKATYRAIDVLGAVGLEVKVVKLKDNLDPDEFLNLYGKEALVEELSHTMGAIEYEIKTIESKYNMADSYNRSKFVAECIGLLSKLPSKAEQDIYLRIVSDISHVSLDILRRDILSSNTQDKKEDREDDTAPVVVDGGVKALKFVMSALVHKKPYAYQAFENNLIIRNGTLARLYDFLKECHNKGKTYTISTLCDYFDVDSEDILKDIIGFDFDSVGSEEIYFKQCLDVLLSTDLKQRQQELLREYNSEIDKDKRREIIKKLGDITKELNGRNK